MTRSAPPEQNGELTYGHWFVAFLDLLGQRDAFRKTDHLPSADDPGKKEAFIREVKNSVGVILTMRRLLESFQNAMAVTDGDRALDSLPARMRSSANALRRSRVHRFHVSDGFILACPLAPEDGHFPIRGVYDILQTCAGMMSILLAAKRPIRGGLDVGTGMVEERELFGAGLVKAYELESRCAQYPRLAVGDTLVTYLTQVRTSSTPGLQGDVERAIATRLLRSLKRDDFDQRWIVDYAGAMFRDLRDAMPQLADILGRALAFARQTRDECEQRRDEVGPKLYARYRALARYLESSGPFTD